MPDLSVLIPARQEQWLSKTVEDVLAHSEGDTDVIVVLDGAWPDPPLTIDPRVTVLHHHQPIGQRAATNLAARVSTSRYVMKLDAHCSVAQGFDVALLDAAKALGPNVTQIPAQQNLHVYNQVCEQCAAVFDQAPARAACPHCQGKTFRQEVVWEPRTRPLTTNWAIDSELHFQYASNKGQVGDFPEIMSFLGACLFVDRAHFLDLGGFDESVGSWGQYAQEWACKEWLSGGRVVCNKRTTFAHFFRVGGIGFPYDIKGSDQERARVYCRDYWRKNAWPQQIYPLRWLVDKFWPVKGWTEEQRDALPRTLPDFCGRGDGAPVSSRHTRSLASSKGLVYYTDNRGDETILTTVRSQIHKACNGYPVVSATLKPLDFGANIVLNQPRGVLTMFRQILAALEALETDYAFVVEHDVIYSRQHFQFTPPRDDVYYYNTNVWHVDSRTGRAITYQAKRTSQLCANRRLLVEHYKKRVARVEAEGFSRAMGFEPGSHRRPERVDDVSSATWHATRPNIDIKHGQNLTPARWSPKEFRSQKNCQGWQESDRIPGWGKTLGCFPCFLNKVRAGQVGA